MIFRLIKIFILFILVLAASTTFVYSFANNVTDEQALLSFKASITADPLGVLDSWNNSTHFCQWKGVICSHRHQRVTVINLPSLDLVGTLSPHIGNLSFLRGIFLFQNGIHGSIPNEIGRLFRLQYLNLGNNTFQGEFPTNLSHCVDIRKISMHGNHLGGKLPTGFASWPKLDWFDLGINQFTGSIPSSIGNISSLRYLDFGQNNLSGSIPLEISHHAKLEDLSFAANNLLGLVPLSLYNISSLNTIDVGSNGLEGSLPTNLGCTLPKLQYFYVGQNKFSGPLPPSVANVSNLIYFDMQGNNITGPIPMNLGSLSNLQLLSLGRNPLGDNMQPNDLSFFNSLVNCTHLRVLALTESGLRGELPNSIGNLSITIEQLYLFENYIYGSIPREIGKLVNMRVIGLQQNLLSGSIPESIGELSRLGKLDLSENAISGIIPTTISNITQLVILNLNNNTLHGSIPTGLFTMSTLQGLALSGNRLNGVIPEQISGLSSQCILLYLDRNLFTGLLPSNIGSLKHLTELDVSFNKLKGDIPTTLGDCVMLDLLHIQGNNFEGKIPSSFKALKSLRVLDLSDNNISENIPGYFDEFPLLEFLNLSHNKLEGEVPKKGFFSNISAFSVDGNLGLCGGIQALHLHACPVQVSRNKKVTLSLRIILLLVLIPLGILLACLALICYRRRNSKQLNDPVPVLKDNQYLQVSYRDLQLATNEFSPNNLLGKGRYGSVYRGVLESVEHIVAVKVLNVEVRGANKSFLAECETLRNIRHRNLTKIITACSSTDFKGNDFKALVFDFMANGSLDSWLHPSPSFQGNEKNLTLLQRLNISIDVALGMDYLHHHTHASIIHGDIKPSNILLDGDFIGHIGDFGLARFSIPTTSEINQAQTSSTGVRGTIGYVPPEYGLFGGISAEGDVYSYGILLLEMFSGKRPTEINISMDSGNNLHDYVCNALPHRVMDIADPRIILDQERALTVNQSCNRTTVEECLASIFQVGILCSKEMQRERIDITVAIKQLNVARERLLQCMQ